MQYTLRRCGRQFFLLRAPLVSYAAALVASTSRENRTLWESSRLQSSSRWRNRQKSTQQRRTSPKSQSQSQSESRTRPPPLKAEPVAMGNAEEPVERPAVSPAAVAEAPKATPTGPPGPVAHSTAAGGEDNNNNNNGAAAPIGSLLDLEDPLNLRLATLLRQPGKAFRVITVTFDTKRNVNFAMSFEDIASGATLQCRLDELHSVYMPWVRQFHAAWITLFVPTLSTANAVLLENALFFAQPGYAGESDASKEIEVPDHVIMSYTKLREVLCKSRRDEQINKVLISNAVLNAYAEDWRRFVHAPNACMPASIVTAAFDFKPGPGQSLLNKELLHAQLSTAATAMLPPGKRDTRVSSSSNSISGTNSKKNSNSGYSNGASGGSPTTKKKEFWSLVFVSAPLGVMAASGAPPMQDLLTGEFVEPLQLGEKNIIYIIGTGTAADSFAKFPLARKGKQCVSILLQDIEIQLSLRSRPNRPSLTTTLTQALDLFSRHTWMGLMQVEDGSQRVPRPARSFAQLHRRSVPREILPCFLESAFAAAPPQQQQQSSPHGVGGSAMGGGQAPANSMPKMNRRLDDHIKAIFNNSERLARENACRDTLQACHAFFVEVRSANVTAARRADNPFSTRNGILEFYGQLWPSLDATKPLSVESLSAKISANGDVKSFVDPDRCIPSDLPTSVEGAPGGILIAWDVKRVILFLRDSTRLRDFLHRGGRVWCAQYAQYLLKGFNHDNLATMERTLLHYHIGQDKLHPLEKLKIIFKKQLDIAVNTRQLTSILHRMDGLLASTEMELRGLQLASQSDVTAFSQHLKASHEQLERLVNDKILEFTTGMDAEVRKKINFRSPQDISTIIYGGALCRHLSTRYITVPPARTPVTALFPHAVCRATATPIPVAYTQAESLNGPKQGTASQRRVPIVTDAMIKSALATIEKYTTRNTLENLMHTTAVVVLTCRVRPGSLLEMISLHCPSTDPNDELRHTVAIDDVVPVADDSEMLTITQLKEKIANYRPLRALQPLKKYGKKSYDLRNLLILTNCVQDKLEALVDTGIVRAVADAVLGSSSSGSGDKAPFERVCFCDIQRALPPPPSGSESFENDFMGLVDVAEHAGLSSKANWEALAREFVSVGGFDGALKAMISHCASLMGTSRDPFRTAHPLPSHTETGLHGQERASTRGLLWTIAPPKLHPLLQRVLRGRSASSGADAIERITVLLSPEGQAVNLSFFTALQQLRFTEKKMQLFEEGALFRAVLPECGDRVHGELCHTVTATGRLSSQSPNLQNIPREEDLRRLIVSRFGEVSGRMIEADYSQLEVVVLAALSRDARMMQEIKDKVDFHCLRVSLMTKEPYEDVVRKAKQLKDPHYIQLRQQAKTFSFQRQYGAGISTIATTTGLTEQEVERLISAEEQHYRDLGRYYRLVTDCVEAGADRLLRLRTLDAATWSPAMRRMILLTEPMHYFVVPTGSKFDFTKDKKSIPRLKNYPVQGLAGEIVQIMCGKVVRRFYEKRNYNNKAFLVNTVHDCVWIDAHQSVADEVIKDISSIMTSTSQVISDLWPDMKLDVPFNADVHIGRSLGELSK